MIEKNSDDENIKSIDLTSFKGKIVTIGTDVSADFRAQGITQLREGIGFKLFHQRKTYQVYVPGYGEHNIYNACPAIVEIGFNKEKVFFCSSAAELYQRVVSLADHNNTTFLFKFPYKFRLSNDPSYRQFMKKVLKGT